MVRKRRFRRKKYSRSKKTFLKVFLVIFIVFSIFTGFHFVYNFLLNWDKLTVKKINYTGIKILTVSQLEKLLNFKPGKNIFKYHIPANIYEKEKWIKKIKIVKNLPDKITVKVEERKPLAILKGKAGDFVLTVDGFIAEKYPQVLKNFKVPVWENFGETKNRLKDVERFLVELMQKEADFYRRIKKISFDGKNLNFYFDDFEVIFGKPAIKILKGKISAIKSILRDLEKKGKKISYIDLRPFTKKMQSAIIKTKEINSKNLGDKIDD